MAIREGSLLFRLHGAILDQLATLGFADADDFAGQLANLYLSRRSEWDVQQFLEAARRVRTGTFRHRRRERAPVTRIIVERLDRRYLGDVSRWRAPVHVSAAQISRVRRLTEGARAATGSRHFQSLLEEYRRAIQLNGIQEFWESRTAGRLRRKPESLAQHSLSMFLHRPIQQRAGFVLREVRSGTGFVDVLAAFGRSRRYLVELKILTSRKVTGFRQLGQYLGVHGLKEGWLVLFDARPRGRVDLTDHQRMIGNKTIRVLVIDINPRPPSALDHAAA